MSLIEGVVITPLKQIPDERGNVMHMFRSDDPEFEKFGEIYFSVIFSGMVKAWRMHTKMTMNLAVIAGNAKLVLYDARENSSMKGCVQEIFLGRDNYVRVKIPPGIYSGFKGMTPSEVIVANCATLPHDSSESIRLDPHSSQIPYDWDANPMNARNE